MRARLAILGVVVIWAANFTVIKAGLSAFEPAAFNALRFPLASATLLAFLAARGRRPRFEPRDRWAILGLGVLGHVAYQPLFIGGLDRTLVGNSSLILATSPVFVGLLSVAVGHERLDRRAWVGIAVAFAGIGTVTAGGARALGFGRSTLGGDLLTLAAAAVWATYTVASAPYVRRYGALAMTAVTMWIGTAGLVLVGIPALARTEWSAIPSSAWAALAFAGIFGIGVAYLLWYTSVNAIGSTRTALFSNLVPVGAILVAWPALGERPTAIQAVGAALILGGVTLARRRERPGPAEV